MMKLKIFLTIAMIAFQAFSYAQSDSALVEKTVEATTTKINPKKHELSGKATFYGTHYTSRRRTASGERFNRNLLTAAHKTLPFGTMVRVTNIKNGKSVIVKINDRGPFGRGRVIDLSPAAFAQISTLRAGVSDVKLEIL